MLSSMQKLVLGTCLSLLITGCTTNYPLTVGTLGGAAAGTGIGAIVGKSSSSITVPHGMAVGAGIGVPAGIALAYASDSFAKHYIIASNDATIERNNELIAENQAYLDSLRYSVMSEEPRGMPDEDYLDYIYMGPSLGNYWR